MLAAVATIGGVVTLRGLAGEMDVTAWSYAALVAHTTSLAFRTRYPVPALAGMVITGVAMAAAGVPVFVPGPIILLAMYSVASTSAPRVSLAALAAAVAALSLQGMDFGGTATWGLIMTGAWVLGNYVRTRRLYAAELEQRAAELQQAREELAEQAVAAERLRIARELHDVVAHAMSVIAVQAGMGAHVIDSQPEEAKRALAAIEVASRGGLAELRRLLGVLRDGAGEGGVAGGAGAASLAPAPGLADLDRLVEDTGRAGVTVDVTVEGHRRDLPAGLDLAVYRIVQEALTNVVKHAGTGRASVTLRYGDRDVAVEVTDEGRGAPANGHGAPGHGIPGMKERAALYGGTVDAGARPGGGFRVAARLPTDGDA